MVTVKGFIDRVVIVAAGQVIATHARSLQRGTLILDPIHYLATLGRKPGALDHTPVYRDWKLPACFAVFRSELEAHHGAEAGARRFVRVLQLLGEHPLDRVRRAVEACQLDHLTSAEAVIERTHGFALLESQTRSVSTRCADACTASQVHVPLPDLSRFNQLLSGAIRTIARRIVHDPCRCCVPREPEQRRLRLMRCDCDRTRPFTVRKGACLSPMPCESR